MRISAICFVFFLFCHYLSIHAQESESGFRELFNGKDLRGWVPVNTAPSTWTVQDGMLHCSGKPIGEIRTERMYQNFVLELEWRHLQPKGNAGVFVWADDITARGRPFHRSIEVQVLENAYGKSRSFTTHGDIFPIHGATMTPINGRGGSRAFPTEERSKPSPNWNHYRIECNAGNISLAVNGKVVTRGTDCSPRKGYICLESEGGIVDYRNIRIKELPDTPIDANQIAIKNRGYRCLYSGVDLSGWKTESREWKSQDWILAFHGKSNPATNRITTGASFQNIGFLFDLRWKPDSRGIVFEVAGQQIDIQQNTQEFKQYFEKVGAWNRFEGIVAGDQFTMMLNGKQALVRKISNAGNGPIAFTPNGPVDLANPFVRDLK